MKLIFLQSLYFMLPAYAANMAPVLFQWIPYGNIPLDHGKTWRSKRILGDHKTYRGLAAGILMAIGVVFIQKKIAPQLPMLTLIPLDSFSVIEVVLLGSSYGIGALVGDSLKSFFKRRMNIAPGKPWIPFDQLDFVIGALPVVGIFFIPPWPHILVILIATPALHFLTNVSAYLLGIKRVWW